jgi:hypothetical protein
MVAASRDEYPTWQLSLSRIGSAYARLCRPSFDRVTDDQVAFGICDDAHANACLAPLLRKRLVG